MGTGYRALGGELEIVSAFGSRSEGGFFGTLPGRGHMMNWDRSDSVYISQEVSSYV